MKNLNILASAAFIIIITLSSCGNKNKEGGATPLISPFDNEYFTYLTNDEVVNIPYKEYGNLLTINVAINDAWQGEMIFDTGASSTCITLAEAQYLFEKGYLSKDDIKDLQQFTTADGNISAGLVINLRKVVIGNTLLAEDVEALVVENQQAPLLLGQSVFKRLPKYTINQQDRVIEFHLK